MVIFWVRVMVRINMLVRFVMLVYFLSTSVKTRDNSNEDTNFNSK